MPTRTLRGAAFHYEDKGAGLALVLVHGFPLDSRMWEAQTAELSGRFRVIAPDLRGFGRSSGNDPFTIESLADDLHALLEDLGALPCALTGLSMGGYTALAYVSKYPRDLKALLLVDTKAESDTAQQREGRQKMIEVARSQGARAVAEQMLPKLLAKDTPDRRPGVARALQGIMEACPSLTIEHALLAMRDRPDQSPNLPSIGVPTLVIVGDGDAITPVDVARSMQRQIPHAQLAVITGSGHMAPMEQPGQVNQAMLRFLQAVQS